MFILKILEQQKVITYQEIQHVISAELTNNGELVGEFTGTLKELEDVNGLRERFGYDKVPPMSKKEKQAYMDSIEEQLCDVNTKDIYLFQGWSPHHDYYILSDYKVDAHGITNISGDPHLVMVQVNANSICAHMINHYFCVLKHTLYPKLILCISLLAMLTSRLKDSGYSPAFVTYIPARSGTGKTHSTLAMINPWDGKTCSFEDTEASIRQTMKDMRDVLLIIDDMSKSKRPGMVTKSERIVRMSGDATTSAKKIVKGQVDDSEIACMTLLTGEDVPHLQRSSYYRMCIIPYDEDEVKWDVLTQLQHNTRNTTFFYLLFLRYSILNADFISDLVSDFIAYRDDFRVKFKPHNISNRYSDMLAWILAMWRKIEGFFEERECPVGDDDFAEKAEEFILGMAIGYSRKAPGRMFVTALHALMEQNRLTIVTKSEAKHNAAFDVIDDDGMWFVKSGAVYQKVKNYYDAMNVDFYDSERAVRSDLNESGLLKQTGKNLTSEFKDQDNRSVMGFWLLKNKAFDVI